MSEPRTICVATTSRADYGILRSLLEEITADPALTLQLLATGSHLVPEQGSTYQEIEADGYEISAQTEILLASDTGVAAAKSIGVGAISHADVLARLEPDILVVLGDRFELLSLVIPALMLGIPVAHIHGGEVSEGAIDDSVRHAITKMASLHFTSAEAHRARVMQMGEPPECVFAFGAPGLDTLHRAELLSRDELERGIEFSLEEPVALVTYHPVTREPDEAGTQIQELLAAIGESGIRALFTRANVDEGGHVINARVRAFCERDPEHYHLVDSLGSMRYLSLLRHVTLMVGNSSSGIIEAPSFRLPVVNVGSRQAGRLRGANVIDVEAERSAVLKGIARARAPELQKRLAASENPYDRFGDGRTGQRMKDALRDVELSQALLKKRFRDIEGVNCNE
jgi:UDP-N-acetylglucosamine 2-epimerase (non-hydrolysing)/GDP/UDP-N,N'-diacetylbacillosamine 2-epimerase (hydrolysing)